MVLDNDKMLIIYGGWSNFSQFSDIQAFNLETLEWVNPDITLEIPRWYHSSFFAKAIPSWKFFVFGGSTGQFSEGESRTASQFSDSIFYMDCPSVRNIQTKAIEITGEKPSGRENASLFWDQQESRLVLFGGWANTWLNDAWALKVNLITGPAYAVYSIEPNKGPQTGKTRVTIRGEGFKNFNIVVRFSYSKDQFVEVQGTYVSETELTCETPPFEKVDKPAIVTLSISKGDYTITKTSFEYYFNTLASECIAFGPGLGFENSATHWTNVIIQARNTKGQNRRSGRDKFEVLFTTP